MASFSLDDIADEPPKPQPAGRVTGRSFTLDDIMDQDAAPAAPARAAPQADAYVEDGMPAIMTPVPMGQQRQAAPMPEPAPFVPQDERTTAGAMGRQFARGAIETAALVPKGAAGLGARLDYNERDIAGTTDRYAAANPQERAQIRREVMGQFRDSPGTRDSLMSRFSDIDEGVAVPRPQAVTPIEQRATYKAGEAIDEFGRTRFPTTRAEDEAFWTGQVPRALGSTAIMLPVAAAGAPLGAFGRLMASVGLATTGSGEAVATGVDRRRALEDMVRAGDAPSPDAYPTDQQLASAAGQGIGPGALDAAAIDNLLRPVVRVPGFRGLIAAVAKKAIEQGVVEGTTEGVQQVMQNLIARFGYNPDQAVLEQVAENVLVGGAVGILTGGAAGGMMRSQRGRVDQPPQSQGQPAIPQQELAPDVSRETVTANIPQPISAVPATAENPAAISAVPPQTDAGQSPDMSAPPPPTAPLPGSIEDFEAVMADPRPVAEIMAERGINPSQGGSSVGKERSAGIQRVAKNDSAVRSPNGQVVPSLRGQGDPRLSGVEGQLRDLPDRDGAETVGASLDRPDRRDEGVFRGELPMGDAGDPGSEQAGIRPRFDPRRADDDRRGVGAGDRDLADDPVQQGEGGVVDRPSLDPASKGGRSQERDLADARGQDGDPLELGSGARPSPQDIERAAQARGLVGSGTPAAPIRATTGGDVDLAAARALADPSPAQKESGVYRKGHVKIGPFEIAIETPRGGTRTGVDADGRPWSNTMPAHYGYLKASRDTGDGKVDVFVGDEPTADLVYVVDQVDPKTGKFDEPKVMLGFDSEATASAVYQGSYGDGSGEARMGAITPMTVPELQAWLKAGDPTKALAYVAPPPVRRIALDEIDSAPPAPAAAVPPPGAQAAAPGPIPVTPVPASAPVAREVATPDQLANQFAASAGVTLTPAERRAVVALLAEGVDPEQAVEIALTRSGIEVVIEAVETEDGDGSRGSAEGGPADQRGAGRPSQVASDEGTEPGRVQPIAAPADEARGAQPAGDRPAQGQAATAAVEPRPESERPEPFKAPEPRKETSEAAPDRARLRIAGGQVSATVNLTPRDRARRAAVIDAISKMAKRMAGKSAPEAAAFDELIVGDFPIFGVYSPADNLIAVALNSPDPIGTARHETIHALRALGLIDEASWDALSDHARMNGWLEKWEIAGRWGDGLTLDQQLEEAIAEEFGVGLRERVWKTGNVKVDAIFQRISEFFRRVRAEIKRALANAGVRDMTDADFAEMMFSLMERGAFRENNVTARGRRGAMAQSAWHGTPHTFDRFDISKIGTGEGAQAYGHGLYFAGRKEVAEHYRNALAPDGSIADTDAAFASADPALLEKTGWGFGSIEEDGSYTLIKPNGGREVNGESAPKAIRKIADDLLAPFRQRGRLYQVELAPAEDEYLLWDKPLSEQSEKVKAALERVGYFGEGRTGGKGYEALARDFGGPINASAKLHAAGIRGIKYLDGSSRGVEISQIDMPDGSRQWEVVRVNSDKVLGTFKTRDEAEAFADTKRNFNYVIFDDRDVEITAMYQMAQRGAQQAAATPEPQKRRFLNRAISALKGGNLNDPRAKVREPHDIGLMRKILVSPRTIGAYFPEFARVFRAGVSQFRTRDMMISDLTEMARGYSEMPQASKEKINKVLEHGRMAGESYVPAADGTIAVKNKIGQQIKGKIGGVTLMADGETVTLTPDEAKAYRAYRATMDEALDRFRKQVLREWGYDPASPDSPQTARQVEDLAKNTEKAGERQRLKTLAEVLSSIQEAKKRGYVPFTRHGSHYVTVTSLQDGKSFVVHREHIEPGITTSARTKITRARLEQEAAALRKRLAEIYPPDQGFEISELREVTPDSLADIPSFSDLDAILSSANLPPEMSAKVMEAVGEAIKKRGFRAHFIKSRNIPGYSTDLERSLADYIVGISGYLARREHMPEIEEAIAGIPAREPKLIEYAKTWNDYIQNPAEELQTLRQIGFFMYLGGRISSAMVNLSQIPIVTMPWLTTFSSVAAANAQIARAYKDAGLAIRPQPKSKGGAGLEVFDVEKLPADVRDVVRAAIKDGRLLPIETYDVMATARGRTPGARSFAAKTQYVKDGLAYAFQAAERTNRLVTFIAAYRLAQNPEVMRKVNEALRNDGQWTEFRKERQRTAEDFATFSVEETQFMQGKINRQTALRGPGTAIFQFKSFMFNYFELLARLGFFGSGTYRGGARFATMAGLMGMLVLTSGVMGLPGAEDGMEILEAIVKWFTGVDPQFERKIREAGGSVAAAIVAALGADEETQEAARGLGGRALARGPLRETGFDISQRVGQGRVAPQPTGGQFDPFWERAAGLLGIPAALALRVPATFADLGRGELLSAGIEAAPEFIADPLRAVQWATEGVKTRARNQLVMRPDEVLPDGTTPGGVRNTIIRAAGFQPTGISRKREEMRAIQRAGRSASDLHAEWNIERAKLVARAEKAKERGDVPAAKRFTRELEDLQGKIEKFNASAAPENRYDFKSPGFRAQRDREMRGQAQQSERKAPKRVRGELGTIRSLY